MLHVNIYHFKNHFEHKENNVLKIKILKHVTSTNKSSFSTFEGWYFYFPVKREENFEEIWKQMINWLWRGCETKMIKIYRFFIIIDLKQKIALKFLSFLFSIENYKLVLIRFFLAIHGNWEVINDICDVRLYWKIWLVKKYNFNAYKTGWVIFLGFHLCSKNSLIYRSFLK